MSDLALGHDCLVTLGKVILKQYKSLVTPFVSNREEHALMPVKVMRLNVRRLIGWGGAGKIVPCHTKKGLSRNVGWVCVNPKIYKEQN